MVTRLHSRPVALPPWRTLSLPPTWRRRGVDRKRAKISTRRKIADANSKFQFCFVSAVPTADARRPRDRRNATRPDIDLAKPVFYIRLEGRRCAMTDISDIIENFESLEDWDDRYRYLIELGRELPAMSAAAHSDANKVQGCASQVWLDTSVRPNGPDGPVLTFVGDSDAHIVRGLIAILFAIFSGRHAKEILSVDAVAVFERIGLREHLTPQRSNGFRSMVERIRADARSALAAA
jgi:cysteine desulfuration protein SufE